MLVENGKILHIDFGFIMSKEPPAKSGPPIKLCAEMIDFGSELADSKKKEEFIK